jgi:hypothetical protein
VALDRVCGHRRRAREIDPTLQGSFDHRHDVADLVFGIEVRQDGAADEQTVGQGCDDDGQRPRVVALIDLALRLRGSRSVAMPLTMSRSNAWLTAERPGRGRLGPNLQAENRFFARLFLKALAA